jgi:pimeloyl-ACP methyl ester carboxylesterase
MRQRHSAAQLFWRGVVAVVGNTAMLTGVYPLVPHLLLARGVRRTPSRDPQVTRARALKVLRAAPAEWACALAVSAARPIGFLGLPVALRQARGPRPVILLHGYAMNRANFLPLARRLAKAGLGPIHGFEYWTLGKVSTAARRLATFVDEVLAATGAEKVDLVGHSMGGLVGRYYVALGGGAGRVHNLITIGSPHSGAIVSGAGIGRPSRELAPGSPFLERLGSAATPPGVRVTAIWSRADALVPSARDAHLPGADEIVYDDLGHLSLLVSRRVAAEVISRLKR